MIRSSTWYLLPLCVSLAVVGCGSQPKTSTSAGSAGSGSADLTEYQRDSLLSTSTIPGAPGVGAARAERPLGRSSRRPGALCPWITPSP